MFKSRLNTKRMNEKKTHRKNIQSRAGGGQKEVYIKMEVERRNLRAFRGKVLERSGE